MARPERDNEFAAQALVDAALTSDRKACEKHKITDRTLRNYRAALETDAELSGAFRQKLLAFQVKRERTWSDELDETLSSSVIALKRMVEEVVMKGQTDAETISAVTSAVLGMAELAMTRDMILAQLEAAKQPRSQVTQEVKALPPN